MIALGSVEIGLGGLQSRPYRQDRLVLVVPAGHELAVRPSIWFAETLDHDLVGLHGNSAIDLAMRRAAAEAGKSLRLRIRVTGLDAMCRMIDNGLGIGVMPQRAFELMRGGIGRRLVSVALNDAWALRASLASSTWCRS